MTGSGVAPDGEWVPAFEGQRPPFQPGHTLSPTTHGAYSRKADELTDRIVADLLADDSVPAHAKAPAYRLELHALARAEAKVRLISTWLVEQGDAAGDGVGDLADDSVRAAYLLLHRCEAQAASARTRLGLTPMAAARLGKTVAQGQAASADVALTMARLHELERAGWTPPADWAPGEQVTSNEGPNHASGQVSPREQDEEAGRG